MSATSAEESANRASASEQNAATSAQEAKSSADSTKGYSESANEAAVNASDSAREAQVSAENAAASANNAEASKTSAQVSAENARVSSQNAEDALQELRDKIASGEFKGEPGEPGKDAVVDATLTQSGQAADAKATGYALALKLTEPSTGLAVGKYFRIAAIDESGHAVLEAVDLPSAPVQDVQVNGTSIVADGVANVNKYDVVRAAMCDGKGAAWTAEEQAAARERMGIGDYQLINDITLEEDVTELTITSEQDGTSYNLKKFVVIMSGFSENTGSSYFRIDAWTKESPNLFLKYMNATKDKYVFLFYGAITHNLFRIDTGVQDKYSNVFPKGYSDICNQNYKAEAIHDTNITKIHFQRSTSPDTLQAGINIKIYGVRS